MDNTTSVDNSPVTVNRVGFFLCWTSHNEPEQQSQTWKGVFIICCPHTVQLLGQMQLTMLSLTETPTSWVHSLSTPPQTSLSGHSEIKIFIKPAAHKIRKQSVACKNGNITGRKIILKNYMIKSYITISVINRDSFKSTTRNNQNSVVYLITMNDIKNSIKKLAKHVGLTEDRDAERQQPWAETGYASAVQSPSPVTFLSWDLEPRTCFPNTQEWR